MKYRDYTVKLNVPIRIWEDDDWFCDGGPNHRAAIGFARSALYDVSDGIAAGYIVDLVLEDEGEEDED